MREIALRMERLQNHLRLGLCIRPRWRSLRRSPRPRSRLGRGTRPPHSSPFDALDRCSWMFVVLGTGRTDGHP